MRTNQGLFQNMNIVIFCSSFFLCCHVLKTSKLEVIIIMIDCEYGLLLIPLIRTILLIPSGSGISLNDLNEGRTGVFS